MDPAGGRARELAAHQAAADRRRSATTRRQPWHDRHQRARHPRRVGVLDHVAAVDDPGRAAAISSRVRSQHLLVGHAAAAADEHRRAAGDLEHARVVGDVVGRVGLDDVGAELDRLAHERHDLLGVAVGAVAALAGLEDERLDHQRHPERLARGSSAVTLRTHWWQQLGLAGEQQQVDDDAGRVEDAAPARRRRR